MGVFSLHFTYLAMCYVMSIVFLSLAQLAHTHVSHISGQHTCAYSVHSNFSLYKIEYSL